MSLEELRLIKWQNEHKDERIKQLEDGNEHLGKEVDELRERLADMQAKLAEAEKRANEDMEAARQHTISCVEKERMIAFDYYQKLAITTEALEELSSKHGLNYWADIEHIASEALSKIAALSPSEISAGKRGLSKQLTDTKVAVCIK